MFGLRRSTVLADAHRAYPEFARALVSVGAVVRVGDAESDLSDATTVDDVDRVFRKRLRSGDVPASIRKNYWVGKTITENGHTLETLWAPDYWSAGTDDNPLRAGKTSQFFAQDVADEYDAILPSQKMLRFGEANADVKIPFIAVQKGGGADDSVQAVITANDKASAALSAAGASGDDGQLKIGYKKSYVTRPGLDGKYLAIYGGRWTAAGGLVQPTSGHAHTTGVIAGTPNYSDYSHGITLVSRKAKLDGVDVDLRTDVFGNSDPKIWGMVSDEGRFDPVFPNSGSSSLAQFSVPGASDIGSGGPLLGGATSRPAASVKDSGVNVTTLVLALAGVGLLVWKFYA